MSDRPRKAETAKGEPKQRRTRNTPRPPALLPERVKAKGGTVIKKRDVKGPLGWLFPALEATYSQIVPRGAPPPAGLAIGFSSLQPAAAAAVLAPASATVWRDLFLEFKRRKASAVAPAAPPAMGSSPPLRSSPAPAIGSRSVRASS